MSSATQKPHEFAKEMAAENPAFAPDPDPGIFIISEHADGVPPTISENNNAKVAKEETKWMGWYRRLGELGLREGGGPWRGLSLALLTAPCLLVPLLLAAPRPLLLLPPLAWLAGRATSALGLPHTTPMLALGLLFRALGWFEVTGHWRRFVYQTRYVGVAMVLLRGGLALRRLPNLPLALLPCTLEATAVAALARYLLGYPWNWGYIYGFAMSAASSSVNAERLTKLKAGGYGAKELYGLILPTSTVENIYSITAFTVTLTLTLIGEAEWYVFVVKGPVAILIGLLFAVSWGFISAIFPNRKDEDLVLKRSAMVVLGSLVVYVGAKELGLPPGGPLGTVATGAAASFFWGAQGWAEGENPVLGVVSLLWDLLEAALFSYVGAELDLTQTSLHDILTALLTMLISMTVRLVVFYILMLIRKQFTRGEILLGLLVWFPKATVLAALSPQVLDVLRRSGREDESSAEFGMARTVLLGSVLEMLITTPLGYLLLRGLAARVLPREEGPATAGLTTTSPSHH